MPSDLHSVVDPLRLAQYDWEAKAVRRAISSAFADDAVVRACHPFGDMQGQDLYENLYAPLAVAIPDLERRDLIVVPGTDGGGNDWVGCGGYYTGAFNHAWLGIPPTRRQVSVRFHEFFRIVDGRIVEAHLLWDLPHVMMQAGVWPMGPSLGREWQVPGPTTQDGVLLRVLDTVGTEASLARVTSMLMDMGKHPKEPPEAMRLETHWHPRFSWYGPSGIGTQRGVAGFRHGHQIPFLSALPDRRGGYKGEGHFFAENNYVAVTGWPNMAMTVTGQGWLGIAPTGAAITMKSLDFWRIENDLIRENWVLIDLLDVWDQLGVDVLARMREMVTGPA